MQAAQADSAAPDTRELDRAVEAEVRTRLHGVVEEAKARAAQMLAYSSMSPEAIATIAVCEVLSKRAQRVDIEVVRAALLEQHKDEPERHPHIQRITRCGWNEEHSFIWARAEDAPRTAIGMILQEAMFRLLVVGPVGKFMKRAG